MNPNTERKADDHTSPTSSLFPLSANPFGIEQTAGRLVSDGKVKSAHSKVVPAGGPAVQGVMASGRHGRFIPETVEPPTARGHRSLASGAPAFFQSHRVLPCLGVLLLCLAIPASLLAQREVQFPPAEGKPPPPAKAPPKTQTGGEETDVIPDPGPTMRKTQERTPPPPTTLTVMYKVEYGEKLKYTHPDGTVQVFDQWQSFPADASKLIIGTNERLADGNNYQYATKPLSSSGFDPVDIPILYMTGDYDFALKPAEVENLRKYLNGGGTIIFNAARGLDEFSVAVVREMRKVFPQKQFMRMPLDHPVFNARYRIQQVMTMVNGVQFQQPPEVYSMDIGTRAAAILVPVGLGTAWSGEKFHPAGKHIIGETAWRLGVNLVAYVLGSTEYGRFLAQQFPQYEGQSRPGDVFRYATVVYRGSWDLHPGLHNSVAIGLNDNTKIDVDYTPHRITLDDPELGNYPLIFMTGHYDFEPALAMSIPPCSRASAATSNTAGCSSPVPARASSRSTPRFVARSKKHLAATNSSSSRRRIRFSPPAGIRWTKSPTHRPRCATIPRWNIPSSIASSSISGPRFSTRRSISRAR